MTMGTWRESAAVLGVAAMACATALATTATAGADEPGTYIVGGGEVRTETPWISALHNGGSFTCTSSIVAGTWVITAAHCVEGGGDFSVRVGSLQRSSGGTEAGVSEVFIHPDYDWPTSDIALLKLDREVHTEYSPLATAEDLADGQAATVMGWGSEKPDWSGPLPENLKYADGTVSDATCELDNLATPVLCTDTDGSVAGGDSGGPVLVKSPATGRIVQGGVCAIGHQPAGSGWAGYTSVVAHADWIAQTMGTA
ncbi:S1 family peptidase [Saccharopolyspora spinosporotrichia]|nr:trypsin [Saccharopolyspora erythraea D]